MKIRIATQKDLAPLALVEMSSGYHKERFDFKPTLRKLFDEKVSIICAEDDMIIGYITLGKDGEIAFLSVIKEYQRKGIAMKLIKNIVDLAKTKGINKLYLDVRKENDAAIKLYLKCGFKMVSINKKKIHQRVIEKIRMDFTIE
ncbi:MAG: GNAT family N-acetyltransferase [Candidatus Staskawiczbacteria bacterium]|nr:GNAT family N-acetyltransferase [Candidatus Staskawiczbacteria bacterium]